MLRDKGVPTYCCGKKVHAIKPGSTEASGEKHIPVYELDGHTIHVTVGEPEHLMTLEYYWDLDDKPKAKFSICGGAHILAVYAFCNHHDLWRK